MEIKSNNIYLVFGNYQNTHGFEIYKAFLSSLPKTYTLMFCLLSANDRKAVILACELDFSAEVFITCGEHYFSMNRENKQLLNLISENKLKVLSFFSKNTKPSFLQSEETIDFILKNCCSVVLFFGELESYAVKIAKKSLDLDIPVFTFPGNVFSNAFAGNNMLLKYGVVSVVSDLDIQDILQIN